MNCTSCGKQLELGTLKFSDKLKWIPNEDNNKSVFKSLFNNNAIVVSDSLFFRYQSISAYCCPNCRIIIINY
ncbi:MAG: PF20097 family protein [Maledivibacter sp.]|nr:PF20097 family protein [Maledivibacter sp.]